MLLPALLCLLTAPATLESGAVRLTWDAQGRLVDGALPPGGFSLRDGVGDAAWQPVTGEAVADGAAVRFRGRHPNPALEVVATFTAEQNWIAVRGEVVAPPDRAVSLCFSLPVACEGWRWSRSLYRSPELVAGHPVYEGAPTRLGSGRLALRPFAAIARDDRTLGLAVPLDFIGQYNFRADPDVQALSVTFDAATVAANAEFANSVPFEFFVLAEPDGWGLRSVLARTYANRPQWFERHRPEGGGWFAWGDILRLPGPLSDFGLMYHEQPESAAAYEHDAALGIRAYPYTESGMYQMSLGDQTERPSRELVLQRLAEWAKPDTAGRRPSGGFPTQESLQAITAAIQNSGARTADGGVLIGNIGQWSWLSGSRWGAQFPLDLTPAVPGGAGEIRMAQALATLNQAHVDGVYLDSYSGYLDGVNYATTPFPCVRFAPQYDSRTGQPCTLFGFLHWMWVDELWRQLPEAQRALLPNLYHQPSPFPWHRFTVLGKEHWTEPAGWLMQQFRMMGHRKVVTQLPSEEDQDERFLRNLLLLDVFPGGYARYPDRAPVGMRDSYRMVIPLLRQLDRLGWEPVTHARPAEGEPRLERYGAAPGPVALAVHNPYDAAVVRLSVDAAALGLTAEAEVFDAVDAAPVTHQRQGGRLDVAVGLPGDTTTVLVIGDRAARGQWHRLMAADRLADARLCLRELAARGQAADAAAVAAIEALTPDSAPAAMAAAAGPLVGDAPATVRARELLALADESARLAAAPPACPSRPAVAPPSEATAGLPWRATFDTPLAPEQWQVDGARGVRVANGRLELELPPDATSVGAVARQPFPFVPRPLVIDADFQYTHGEHDKYLRLSLRVQPNVAGGGEFLLIRIEGDARRALVWAENHEGPATNYQYRLTPQVPIESNRPHHLRLRLDRERFRLEVDGKLIGEGRHECEFAVARLNWFVASGHRGNGDVCWWDSLEARAEEAVRP